MTHCQHCKRRAQIYLCDDCTTILANMLDQIPWLIEELDARIQKLDRIPHATIGRSRRPDELSVIDFDAAETARKIRKQLRRWVETVAERHAGRRPPGLDTVGTADLARWLQANVEAIARLDLADRHGNHQLYDEINKLVGSDQKGGQLVRSINRTRRHFAGLCPTITHRDQCGDPVDCGTSLYADEGDRTTTCPTCKQQIDVDQNRERTAKSRDLMTADRIFEVLTNIGEPVTRDQLNRWIKARRLRRRGWLHDGEIVKTRLVLADQAVYSFDQAQKVRRRDHQLTHARRRIGTQSPA